MILLKSSCIFYLPLSECAKAYGGGERSEFIKTNSESQGLNFWERFDLK